MSETVINIITHGMSGKFGCLIVFSQRNDKTIVSMAPTRTAELYDKQKKNLSAYHGNIGDKIVVRNTDFSDILQKRRLFCNFSHYSELGEVAYIQLC